MNDEDFRKNVYIPNNLKLRLEIFKGFGVKEFIITIISSIFTILLCLLIQKLSHNTNIALIIGFTIISIIVMGILKDKHNMCFFSHLKILINFILSNKTYNRENMRRWNLDEK